MSKFLFTNGSSGKETYQQIVALEYEAKCLSDESCLRD